MFGVLKNRTYRRLFLAQVIALAGTGLATIALALLAHDLAGDRAGVVLGTALAVKMIAYVFVSPLAAAAIARLPRKNVLILLDLVRAAIVLLLPFVTAVWQVYVLIFLLQSASAAFTPAFQATIPEILPDEDDYTNALSLSRLAYDLENLASPVVAAAMLTVMDASALFAGTSAGFVASALLILATVLPRPALREQRPFSERLLQGMRIFRATPRLRGLAAVNVAVAAAGAFVIVNTVVYVQSVFALGERNTAIAMAAFGAGSMVMALVLPRLLHRIADRTVMLSACALLVATLAAVPLVASWPALLMLWPLVGAGYAAAQLPAGRLLRRSAHEADRPPVFAAQFALSHAGWLMTYPLAGWAGDRIGLGPTAAVLAFVAAVALAAAFVFWREESDAGEDHAHPELPDGHPHLAEGDHRVGKRHRHRIVIDELHHHWPA